MHCSAVNRTPGERFIDRSISTWDSVPQLKGIMSFVLVEDRKLQNQIAEAYLKLGVPGRASEYYKIYKENRLNGDEIKHLVNGHELSVLFYGYPCKIDHLEDGKSRSEGWSCEYIGTSTWWIENDMLCGTGIEDLKDCKITEMLNERLK